jgi:C_GCAxxG_C_C family probable redox protein
MHLDEERAGKQARMLHDGGFHCAEAVLLGILEQTPLGGDPLIPRSASCFRAGVGGSHKEICGALAGGLMAGGCLLGRDKAGQPLDFANMVATEVRDRFEALYGSTICFEILEAMGPQENSQLCHQLSGTTAALVCQIINETES